MVRSLSIAQEEILRMDATQLRRDGTIRLVTGEHGCMVGPPVRNSEGVQSLEQRGGGVWRGIRHGDTT
jgi:hypothetical protein